MDKEFFYLLGALGDASITYRKKKGEYRVEYEQKNKRWLERSIIPRIAKLYKPLAVKKRKSGLYRVSLYSKQAYFDFLSYWKDLVKLLTLGKEEQLLFVRGFFDAEGSAPKRNKGTAYRLYISQKIKKRLQIISVILRRNGIITGKIKKYREIYYLPIRMRENIRLFRDLVKPEHSDKEMALNRLINQ